MTDGRFPAISKVLVRPRAINVTFISLMTYISLPDSLGKKLLNQLLSTWSHTYDRGLDGHFSDPTVGAKLAIISFFIHLPHTIFRKHLSYRLLGIPTPRKRVESAVQGTPGEASGFWGILSPEKPRTGLHCKVWKVFSTHHIFPPIVVGIHQPRQ